MHRYTLATVACCLFSSFGLAWLNPACGAERPNIVVIYTDDQGTLDANCYGSKDLVTPTFDRLAATGIRFTQMYSPSAICSASRAGLMTGRFPARAGVPSNVSSALGQPGMPTEELTIAELMRTAGYRTGHVGKWHLGYTPDTMPNGQGFQSSFGHMGGCIDNYSHFFYWNGPNRHDLWRDGKEIWMDGAYFGDAMVDECKRFISASQDGPFFLYWAINWPHYPLQGTAKWRERYASLPSPRRMYAAFVSSMDERIGQVVDHLEQLGLRENTIIVLQSDHGHSVEERTFFGGGNPGPYRGAKGCLFEAGIRVPSIVSWPGGLPQGVVRGQLAVGCDWFPTLAELASVNLPQVHLDGRSLATVLKSADAPSPHDSFYWQLGRGPRAQWVVRRGDWKLLGNPTDSRAPKSLGEADRLFLANLAMDETEARNLAADHPETVQELQELQRKYAASLAADGR
ncbi:MAG: sulfatase-like hydrolase/transferase [Planctomycetales bacterium]|nr:sulfatase-like hydrolase/transferase [Planctomycetales bacterium]